MVAAAPVPAPVVSGFDALGAFMVRGEGARGVLPLGLAGRRVPAEGEVAFPRRDVETLVGVAEEEEEEGAVPFWALAALPLACLAGDITRPRLGEEVDALSSAINLLAAASSVASSSLRATLIIVRGPKERG